MAKMLNCKIIVVGTTLAVVRQLTRKLPFGCFLKNELCVDQQDIVSEFFDKLSLATRREQKFIYQEGFHDCIRLLKCLGVLP